MVNQKLTNWQQELDSEAVDEYNALRRSLQRNDGFGLFFVQCSPAVGENIIESIQEDIIQKKVDALRLTEPVDSLYNIISDFPNINNIDILFISGLEYSLYQYEEYTFGEINQESYATSKERYSQSWRGVPRFLGYLNLQRDRFREDFEVSFVFLLPSFGIDYFIKRAPDFFDWRSGLFKFIQKKNKLVEIDLNRIFQATPEQSRYDLLEIQALTKELELSSNEKVNLNYKRFLLSMNCQRYEDAVTYVDRWLAYNKDDDLAWYGRGIALRNLGRLDEAIASYDKALEINPDYDSAWNNRGIALINLGRYEEAIASYDKALAINPDYDSAWYNRGYALDDLGRYEEAITSYDKALEINPDYDSAWNNRGYALGNLGRYEEAIASYDKALAINPDYDSAWYNRGIALDDLGRYEEAITSYDKALAINPYKDNAWYNRGIALRNLGRLDEAIASYDKALAINPDNDSAWYNRGIAIGNLGRYEEAIASYDKALELNPDKDNAWYNRACNFALQNQIEPAIENLAKAISLNKKYQEMAKTDTDFDNIREDSRFQSLINSQE